LRARTAARLAAVQALYQVAFTGQPAETVAGEFADYRLTEAPNGLGLAGLDNALFTRLLMGVTEHRAALAERVGESLQGVWRYERLGPTLEAVLLAAAFELRESADTPAQVIVSDYVDLAGELCSETETALVNGLLDRLARQLRPEEMAAGAGSDG
jgi:N utilization substance protein B